MRCSDCKRYKTKECYANPTAADWDLAENFSCFVSREEQMSATIPEWGEPSREDYYSQPQPSVEAKPKTAGARLFYGLLWALTIVAFSVPWYSADGETFSGWNFVIPFSMTYLIGIIFGFIVLITRFMPFGLTIAAGVLMLVGVTISILGGEVAVLVAELVEQSASAEGGIAFAFVTSIAYLIVGAWLGKRMASRE